MVVKNLLSDIPSLCVCACVRACVRAFNNSFVSQRLFDIHEFGIELISSMAQSRYETWQMSILYI